MHWNKYRWRAIPLSHIDSKRHSTGFPARLGALRGPPQRPVPGREPAAGGTVCRAILGFLDVGHNLSGAKC